MFLDELEKKVTDISSYLPYVIFAFIVWLTFLTILIFLLYFNVVDINTIVSAMKQCIV